MHTGVQHGAQGFYNGRPNAAKTFRECIATQQQHAARFRFTERRADTARVRADKIYLQLADLFAGDANAGEFSEAGVDAVSGFTGCDKFLDHGARGVHAFDGSFCERNFFAAKNYGVKLIERQIVSGEGDGHCEALPAAE